MIRLIGLNKIFLMLFLGMLLALFVFYYYMVASPEIASNDRELRNNNGEISKISNDLNQLKIGIEQFKEQEDQFQSLYKHDLFNPQDRVEARKRLTAIRDSSGVSSAQYTINSAKVDKNEDIKKAGYKILNTPMTFRIEAIDDLDVYRFIYLLNHGFPGQITLEEVSVSREEEITLPLLKQIGIGQEEMRPLINAEIEASWRTSVPDTQLELSGGGE